MKTEKRQAFDSLVEQWSQCIKCPIGGMAKTHVFGKGSLQAEVVFIGEGPGKLENIEGRPFVGLAGRLLHDAITATNTPVICFFTNLVACRPTDRTGGSNRAPSFDEIRNCRERLQVTLQIIKPKKIILLGRVPQMALSGCLNHWRGLESVKVYSIYHPAFILRQGGVTSVSYQKYVKRLKEVFDAQV